MPITKRLLKKAAKKMREEDTPSKNAQKQMVELDKYLQKKPEQPEEPKDINKPEVIDFSLISTIPVGQNASEITHLNTQVEDDIGLMRNLPVKAHRIPTQYLKKMSAAWKPPEFTTVDEKYYLIKPYSMANLKWDPSKNRLEYYILEPFLSTEHKKQLEIIKERAIDLLDINLFEIKEPVLIKRSLREKVDQVIRDYGIQLTEDQYKESMYYIFRDFLGLSKIEALMHDPAIEDISCDGIDIPLYVYHRKYGSIPTNVKFDKQEDLNEFVIRLSQRCGRHISVAEPLLDAALPDGSRVQATFSSHRDIAMHGSTFTIRKFTKDPLTIIDIVNFGTVPPMIAAYLWLAIEYGHSLLIAGGTATGKTSFLGALSMFLPADAKIVSIEDTPEVRLPHEHWVQKVVRTGFGRADLTGRKQGEVTMYDLLRAALRERPDEIIVGEVRGKEAYVLFQGMATGHSGMATIHGDSVDSVMHRLQTKPINLSPGLMQHLDIIIILTRAKVKGVEVRRAKQIVEILGLTRDQQPIVNTLFEWTPADESFKFSSDKSYILQEIIHEKGVEESEVWKELQRRTKIVEWMRKNDIRYYKDVGKIIQRYYSDPEAILRGIT
ncbi:type II/IV secretion system ATPase subunit [archaeon]|nr:type II/IV secretion system ATPase subunit [archaeon]